MKVDRRTILVRTLQVLTVVAFFVAWQLLVVNKVLTPLLFPTPVQFAKGFYHVLTLSIVKQEVVDSLEITFSVFFVSLGVGIVLGLIIGSSSYLKQVLDPYLVLINTIPKAVFLPALFLLLGTGFSYQFWFGFLIALVPITLNIMYSVATVPTSLITAARSMGASTMTIYRRVVMPSITPTLLGTARYGFAIVFGSILGAEQYVANVNYGGLGYLVVNFTVAFSKVPIFVVVAIASLISTAAFLTLLGIERWAIRWKRVSLR